jgi:hypothetical protein
LAVWVAASASSLDQPAVAVELGELCEEGCLEPSCGSRSPLHLPGAYLL